MLDDRHRRRVELRNAFECGVGIVQVVVREFLALHLHRGRDTRARAVHVECRSLVRVLAIAQRLTQRAGDRETPRKCLAASFGEPRGDRGIIRSRARVRLAGEPPPQPERGAAVLRDLVQHLLILIGFGQHGNKVMVLRRAPDQRETANVDILDAHFIRGALRHRLLERIEVHRNEIDRRDAMFRHLSHVLGHIPPAQNAAMDLRHQRLHPPVEDLRKTGMFRNLLHRHAGLTQHAG